MSNPQDLLWAFPTSMGNWWWVVCAVFSIVGATLCFLHLIMNERFSVVMLSRLLMTGGYIAIGMVPLNSGWLPWGVLLLSIGGCYTYFLIATNWCHRVDKWAIVKTWFAKVLEWLAGPRSHSRREDLL